MVDSVMVHYWLKGCIRCKGDLQTDEDEWKCIQCGERYYPSIINYERTKEPQSRYSIDNNDSEYVQKNIKVINLIEKGFTSSQISGQLGKNVRTVRKIRETYNQLKET